MMHQCTAARLSTVERLCTAVLLQGVSWAALRDTHVGPSLTLYMDGPEGNLKEGGPKGEGGQRAGNWTGETEGCKDNIYLSDHSLTCHLVLRTPGAGRAAAQQSHYSRPGRGPHLRLTRPDDGGLVELQEWRDGRGLLWEFEEENAELTGFVFFLLVGKTSPKGAGTREIYPCQERTDLFAKRCSAVNVSSLTTGI